MAPCNLCPRMCGVDRSKKTGYCRAGDVLKVAKAYLHMWEEPCISGTYGSGTIFFSHCNIGCVFCQNYKISSEGFGKMITVETFADIMLRLQSMKAHNINLVTPTPWIPQIAEGIRIAKEKGLYIPIIYNTSAYENVASLSMLQGLIDIYLPDLKYFSDKYSTRYSNAPDYFKHASAAVLEMYRQAGVPSFDKDGMLAGGLMIRHMMLPGLLFDSKKIVDWVREHLPEEVYLNIMCQYTPAWLSANYPEIHKRVHPGHYEALIDYAVSRGILNGFMQDAGSIGEEYTPEFDLSGIEK